MTKNSKMIAGAVVVVVAMAVVFTVVIGKGEKKGNEELATFRLNDPSIVTQAVGGVEKIIDTKDDERLRIATRERLVRLNEALNKWSKIEEFKTKIDGVNEKLNSGVTPKTIISQIDTTKKNLTNKKGLLFWEKNVLAQLNQGTLRDNIQILDEQLRIISVLGENLKKVRNIVNVIKPDLKDWTAGPMLFPLVEKLRLIKMAAEIADLGAALTAIDTKLAELKNKDAIIAMWGKVGTQNDLLKSNVGQNYDPKTEIGVLMDQIRSISNLQSLMTALYELASVKSEVSGIKSAWMELAKEVK